MSNADAIYAVSLSLLGGIVLGSALDTLVSMVESKVMKSNTAIPVIGVELFGQLALAAILGNEFIAYMNGMALPLASSPIGTAPFWVFLLNSQPNLTAKLNWVMYQVKTLINSVVNGNMGPPAPPGASAASASKAPALAGAPNLMNARPSSLPPQVEPRPSPWAGSASQSVGFSESDRLF